MPRYEILSGVVEQDGTRYGPDDVVDLADHSADHLREHTNVELEAVGGAVAEAGDDPFLALSDIGEARAQSLRGVGYGSLDELADAFADDVAAIDGISAEHASDIIHEANELTEG